MSESRVVRVNVSVTESEINIPLTSGWNFISIPLVISDTSVGSVLSLISGNYSIVWSYNATDTGDHWKKYDPNAPFGNDLLNMDEGNGYWIYMKTKDKLIIGDS